MHVHQEYTVTALRACDMEDEADLPVVEELFLWQHREAWHLAELQILRHPASVDIQVPAWLRVPLPGFAL